MTTLTSKFATETSVPVLSPQQLRERLGHGASLQIVDVREYPEFAAGHVADARLIPLGDLERRWEELKHKPVVCICRSGKRAAQAAEKLTALGLKDVACLDGGLLAWEHAGLPLEKSARAPWALERQVRFTAGLLVLAGLGFSLIWPPAVGLAWFVGAGLMFAAATDWCGMGLLLARMPWNKTHRDCSGNGCG